MSKKSTKKTTKKQKEKKNLGFIEITIDLPVQWMVTPLSHTQGRKEERAVEMRFHGAVSLLIADYVD